MEKILMQDLIKHKLHYHHRAPPQPINIYAATLRRLVDEMLPKINKLLKKMEEEETTTISFRKTVNKTISNRCNWGRVLSIYAFAAALVMKLPPCKEAANWARHLSFQAYAMRLHQTPPRIFDYHELLRVFIKIASEHAETKLAPWISEHGGWDAFHKKFSQ